MRRHRDMVLLIGGGRDRIDAGRIGALLVLGDQRRGRHLRDHEARVEPRAAASGSRAGPTAPGRPASRCGARRSSRSRRSRCAIMSAAKATGSAWKLPPDSASSVSAKISGLSETPLASVLERRRGLAQQVERRAHHLRLAAQAIRVLHALVVDAMRSADRRARHQRAQRGRGLDLAAVAAQRVDARVERRVRALGRFGRQRAGDQRRAEQRLGLEQPGERIGGRELGAVEQRQAFLGAERRAATSPARASASSAGSRSPRDVDLADADHRRRHVRERGEVAATRRPSPAHGTPGSARARASLRAVATVSGCTPEAPCARLASLSAIISRTTGDRQRLADAGGMAQHDIALERREIVVVDADAGELAEAGVDAVDRLRPRARMRATAGGAGGDPRRARPDRGVTAAPR